MKMNSCAAKKSSGSVSPTQTGKKKRRKRGKIVYLDGIHYHYSCIVSPLFIMTRINVLPGMHTLDNRGGYYLVKSSSPMGKRA